MYAHNQPPALAFNPWDALNITATRVADVSAATVHRYWLRAMVHCHPDKRDVRFAGAFPSWQQINEARDFLLNERNRNRSFVDQYDHRTYPFHSELERGNVNVFDMDAYPNSQRPQRRGDTAPISVAVSREVNPGNAYLPHGSFRNPVVLDDHQPARAAAGSAANPFNIDDDPADIINDPDAVVVISDSEEDNRARAPNAPPNVKVFVGWPAHLAHLPEADRPIVMASFTQRGSFIKKIKKFASSGRAVHPQYHQPNPNIRFLDIAPNPKFRHCRDDKELRAEVLRLVLLPNDSPETEEWVWDD